MKKVNSGLSYLQKIYKIGVVAYPRVENNYIKEKPFQFFPHPPLFAMNNLLKPLEEEELTLNKKTALLFLSNKRILSPANIKYFNKVIDKYLEEDLNIKKEKEEELKKIFQLLDKFLKENDLTISKIIKMYMSIFINNMKAKKILFDLQENKFFTLDFTISRLRAIRTFFLKDIKNDFESQIEIKFAKNVLNAVFQYNKIIKNFSIKRKKL